MPGTRSGGNDAGVTTEIHPARTAADYADATRLIRAYAASLPFALDFQGVDEELADLPAEYGPPAGALLIARHEGEAVGCVAVRPLEGDISEMKRLYVLPTARGLNVGRTLARDIISAARDLGYRRMRLDTIETMSAAMALYRSLGFVEIPPYYDNPIAGARFFELPLR